MSGGWLGGWTEGGKGTDDISVGHGGPPPDML